MNYKELIEVILQTASGEIEIVKKIVSELENNLEAIGDLLYNLENPKSGK